MQHKSIETFSNTYGLNLGTAYYTDFITGTSTLKRSGFNQALSDARKGNFDVLLIYHTSRFARNRADAIRYKMELKKLGKILVFISQNIISGRNTDFLNEGINEILDEQYSRNLSKWVTDGLSLKHDSVANGKPPLGYKSEKSDTGKRERKVPNLIGIGGDPKKGGMEALIALLRVYSTGRYSYELLAEHLALADTEQGLENLSPRAALSMFLKTGSTKVRQFFIRINRMNTLNTVNTKCPMRSRNSGCDVRM